MRIRQEEKLEQQARLRKVRAGILQEIQEPSLPSADADWPNAEAEAEETGKSVDVTLQRKNLNGTISHSLGTPSSSHGPVDDQKTTILGSLWDYSPLEDKDGAQRLWQRKNKGRRMSRKQQTKQNHKQACRSKLGRQAKRQLLLNAEICHFGARCKVLRPESEHFSYWEFKTAPLQPSYKDSRNLKNRARRRATTTKVKKVAAPPLYKNVPEFQADWRRVAATRQWGSRIQRIANSIRQLKDGSIVELKNSFAITKVTESAVVGVNDTTLPRDLREIGAQLRAAEQFRMLLAMHRVFNEQVPLG